MLSSSVLGFLLFLPYGKLTVFLSLFLLTALGFPFQLTLLMLEFQRLLCLCANAFILQLTLNFALHSFGIDFSLYDYFDLDRGTEFQFMPILQQKIIDLILYLILKVTLHGVKLGHRVADWCAGGKNHATVSGDLIHIAALGKHIGGFLCIRCGKTSHIPHFCV